MSNDYNAKVEEWLKDKDSNITYISVYKLSKDSIDFLLKKADGIIITGGEDVNPHLYDSDSLLAYCGVINDYRDSLEYKLINYALENKIPLLGICRGLQIINVSQGGSLIADIPTFVGDSLHRLNGPVNHEVFIDKNSNLRHYISVDSGMVLSNHHQCINRIANVFVVSAIAKDSVIEAIEFADTANKAFFLAIQWHPEGMNYNLPLSKDIANEFLKNVYKHK